MGILSFVPTRIGQEEVVKGNEPGTESQTLHDLPYILNLKSWSRVSEMAQKVIVLTNEPDDLSLTPKAHMVEGESLLL